MHYLKEQELAHLQSNIVDNDSLTEKVIFTAESDTENKQEKSQDQNYDDLPEVYN